jgi:hypothetical protein
MKLPSWQIRTTLLIGTVGPPVASLILLAAIYLPYCAARSATFDASSFAVAYILFAVPVGYVFGIAPAMIAGALYCGALTAMTTRRPGVLVRACLGVIAGGLVGGFWFHAVLGPDSHAYGPVAALVLAVLALRWPPARTQQIPPG